MLQYRIEGNGLPLLLIHGWGVTYTIWQNLAPLLKSHFQLIMIELPGVGGSPEVDANKPYYPACAEALEELRQTLDIEKWSILAYSSGTRAGEVYLQRYPQHVARAVFLCPVYLNEVCSLGLRLEWWLENTRPTLVNWALSDWRLYGLVLAVAFNGRPNDYVDDWTNEIEMQRVENLKRMLHELPGKGRAPFEVPAISSVNTLFVWGRRDALTDRPRRPRLNDVFIPANHSAPMLAAPSVAQVVLPFLTEGKLVSTKRNWPGWKRPHIGPVSLSAERIQLLNLIRNASRRRLALARRHTLRSIRQLRS